MIQKQVTTKQSAAAPTTTGERSTTIKYRNKIQIMAEILSAVDVYHRSGGLTQSKIMYKSLLSYAQIKVYTCNMITYGLIDFNDETKKYTITHKGLEFLEGYRKIAELVPDVDLYENQA